MRHGGLGGRTLRAVDAVEMLMFGCCVGLGRNWKLWLGRELLKIVVVFVLLLD